MDYFCAECKKEAKVIDGKVVRSCEHDGLVIAPRTSVLFGDGGAGEKSIKQRLVDLFKKVF